jgi:uncharacterized protein YlxW (UPF0749 family)
MVTLKIWLLGTAAILNFSTVVFGVWDASSTAVLLGVFGAIVTCVASAWPQLKAAGLKAQALQRETDLKVQALQRESDIKQYKEQMDTLIAQYEKRLQQYEVRLGQAADELRVRDKRIEALDLQLREAESRATKWQTRWEVLSRTPTSSDAIPVTTPSSTTKSESP